MFNRNKLLNAKVTGLGQALLKPAPLTRLRHIAGTKWGLKQYLKVDRLEEVGDLAA